MNSWDARIDPAAARPFWLEHRDFTARELSAKYPERAWRTWQNRINMAKQWFPELWAKKVAGAEDAGPPPFKGTHEIRSDGTQASERLIEITAEQDKDPRYLLTAHGFDPDEFELVNAKSNFWNQNSVEAGMVTLCQSKITVKPKLEQWCIEDLAEAVRSAVTPVKVKQPRRGKMMLEAPFADTHLGNSTLDWYLDTIARSCEHIASRTWEQVVITIGSDFFHTDNFKNTTSNGTPQSSMWWPEAWRDGLEFAGTIIETALEHSPKVFVYYVPGNHDESMSWAFCQMLEARYPQAIFDTDISERKVHTFGSCAVGLTHGDEKTRKDLDRVFVSEFPAFAAAAFREVHMGHLHHEKSFDHYGVNTRSLPTGARTDKWHRESGFVGNRKAFQLFEWDADSGVTDIHYV